MHVIVFKQKKNKMHAIKNYKLKIKDIVAF